MKLKLILILIVICSCALSLAAVNFKKNNVIAEEVQSSDIPVVVTLSKYQLERMLRILEEENGYGRPADPQDMFTFTSIAKGNEYSKEYNVSSTHLARKPIK
jgi:hypothetical protein|tara:strand:+ start:118 stop:423 length:306 start_codon:yes stop_codon:yes gene_type:complete